MGYLAVWKVLEEMIIEFRKRGIPIPATVMNDLKSAKTTIKLIEVDKSCSETAQKVEEYLGNVEAYLVTEAQKKFAPEYIDEWLRCLEAASCETCEEKGEEPRFISGLPRDQKWIRVEPLASLPLEKLKQLAEETNLSCNVQEDGHVLVYGKAEDIKEFIKKMTDDACMHGCFCFFGLGVVITVGFWWWCGRHGVADPCAYAEDAYEADEHGSGD